MYMYMSAQPLSAVAKVSPVDGVHFGKDVQHAIAVAVKSELEKILL